MNAVGWRLLWHLESSLSTSRSARWRRQHGMGALDRGSQAFLSGLSGGTRRKGRGDSSASPLLPLAGVVIPLKVADSSFSAQAETTRFMLRYGQIPYVDHVVWGRTFAARRAAGHYAFDKVPVMHVAERPAIPQSGTMARFAAKLAGCYPSGALAKPASTNSPAPPNSSVPTNSLPACRPFSYARELLAYYTIPCIRSTASIARL